MPAASRTRRVVMLLSNPGTHDERPLKEAHALSQVGYEVTVLAWDRERETKKDTVYPDGVAVKRMRLHAGHGTPMLTVPKLLLFYIWCLVRLAFERPDAVHAHDVDTLPVGLFRKAFVPRRTKLAYDMHDLPEAFLRFFPLSQQLQAAFLAVCRKRADLVIVASEGYLGDMQRLNFSKDKLALVLNAPELTAGRLPKASGGPFAVLYYGGLEEERGVRLLVEAVSGLPDVTLTIAGRGTLAGWIASLGKEGGRVKFLGWLGQKELSKVVAEASLIPSLYHPTTQNIRLSTPGKLLASLSLSIPVLVPSGTFQAELVRRFGCGVVVDWGDKDGLREAIRVLSTDEQTYRKMAESAHRAFTDSLNWEASRASLLEAYESMLTGPSAHKAFNS